METTIQIEEFETPIDNFIFEHFNSIHGEVQDIIFCPDFRIIINLNSFYKTVSYHTDFIDMTKKYTINEIINQSETLQTFLNSNKNYTISVYCCFDKKNENNNEKPILLLHKDIKSC
jgi:hypothetical protein